MAKLLGNLHWQFLPFALRGLWRSSCNQRCDTGPGSLQVSQNDWMVFDMDQSMCEAPSTGSGCSQRLHINCSCILVMRCRCAVRIPAFPWQLWFCTVHVQNGLSSGATPAPAINIARRAWNMYMYRGLWWLGLSWGI